MRRTGSYLGAAAGAEAVALRELEARERELDLRDRELKRTGLLHLVETLGEGLAPDVRKLLQVKAAEAAAGEKLPVALLPPAHHDWLGPTDIAELLSDRHGTKITVNRVGLAITALGIRGNIEGLCEARLSNAPGRDKTVTAYFYAPQAVDQIEAHLLDKGHLKKRAG